MTRSTDRPAAPALAPGGALRTAGRIALGAALVFAGTSHLTFARQEFQAQVPGWVPVDDDGGPPPGEPERDASERDSGD